MVGTLPEKVALWANISGDMWVDCCVSVMEGTIDSDDNSDGWYGMRVGRRVELLTGGSVVSAMRALELICDGERVRCDWPRREGMYTENWLFLSSPLLAESCWSSSIEGIHFRDLPEYVQLSPFDLHRAHGDSPSQRSRTFAHFTQALLTRKIPGFVERRPLLLLSWMGRWRKSVSLSAAFRDHQRFSTWFRPTCDWMIYDRYGMSAVCSRCAKAYDVTSVRADGIKCRIGGIHTISNRFGLAYGLYSGLIVRNFCL